MKSFEEKYTAWVDDRLNTEERTAFEREHDPAEKDEMRKLRAFLKENLSPPLSHPDFFNDQIRQKIEQEKVRRASRSRRWLGVPRLAWSGLLTLAGGAVLFLTMIPHGNLSDPRSGYVAEVLKTKTGKSAVTATVENRKGMTIIKLNGLDKLPPEKDPSH